MRSTRSPLRRAFVAGLLAAWLAIPAAAQQVLPLTRIAFGSCADQEEPQPIWRAVLAYRPELFVFAGDNVYGDYRDGKLVADDQLMSGLRHAYQVVTRQPGFMRVKNTIPHLVTWDDHDYGKDDAGGDFFAKEESQRLFVDFWDLPADDPRRARAGVYSARTFGAPGQRVQVILLDTRYFRSPWKPTDERNAAGKERYLPDDDPGKTMLGEAQWTWLAERLREPAELRLIVSSIQLLADGHGWERWGNFPRERQKLYDLVRDTGASGVVLLSGDRHVGALYRQTEGVAYPLIELTSSGLNMIFAKNTEAGPNRIGAVYGAVNFGTVDIDWWDESLTLSLRSMNGEAVRRQVIRFAELRPGGR
jgi:alkaline phosphatase D